jgi:hypothetical protein
MRFTTIHLALWLAGLLAGLSGHRAVAQVTAPTQGGMVNATKVTATSMELIFGTGGTGQGRVVAVAATGSNMWATLSAADNKFYSAAPDYGKGSPLGQGYAVYNGSGKSVVITGLQPRTRYYITNAEYNTDGSTILYNTSGGSVSVMTSDVPKTPAPLPVELTSFTGAIDSYNVATLRWTTASERNTAYFALESSTDGSSFAEVSRVAAAGSSNQALSYHWTDPQRLAYTTYYRLRQADNDGTASYSAVVALAPTSATPRLVSVYPNPSAGQPMQLLVQGYAGEAFEVRVVDTMGRSVASQKLALATASATVPLALPHGLASGTYLVTLAGNGAPIQKRIVISD